MENFGRYFCYIVKYVNKLGEFSILRTSDQVGNVPLFFLNNNISSSLSATQFKLIQKHISKHDDEAELCKDNKGKLEANADLRDYENISLVQDIYEYFEKEVKPHVPLAWIDEKKRDEKDGKVGIVGYEIPFNRHFYEYVAPRSLEEIDKDLDVITKEIMEMLHEV